jgi:hypothetical protein
VREVGKPGVGRAAGCPFTLTQPPTPTHRRHHQKPSPDIHTQPHTTPRGYCTCVGGGGRQPHLLLPVGCREAAVAVDFPLRVSGPQLRTSPTRELAARASPWGPTSSVGVRQGRVGARNLEAGVGGAPMRVTKFSTRAPRLPQRPPAAAHGCTRVPIRRRPLKGCTGVRRRLRKAGGVPGAARWGRRNHGPMAVDGLRSCGAVRDTVRGAGHGRTHGG